MYYYFSTHTSNESIYNRLKTNRMYELMNVKDQEVFDELSKEFQAQKTRDISPVEFCNKFIQRNSLACTNLVSTHGESLKYVMNNYLGYVHSWGASAKAFGRNSNKRAENITEEHLIEEMTSLDGSILKLLDAANYDLAAVKPFLPAIMISLDANTRDRNIMRFRHTGRFSFDFDAFPDSESARHWMNELWRGTKNVKPYMAFLSPRGKGFKVFCRVDVSNSHFQVDFEEEDRSKVMKNHKTWYEAAVKEIIKDFPQLEDRLDTSTNDPQRLTYLPFIEHKSKNFKYDETRVSEYVDLRNVQLEFEKAELKKKMENYSNEIASIMKDQGVKSAEDAYYMVLKNQRRDFDVEVETDKFISVVDKLVEMINSDDRVYAWSVEKFDDYVTLNKLSWVLYGTFGDMGIEQLKRLVPSGSNKLDENSTDYRWAVRSRENYDDDQIENLHPGAFYNVVKELGELKDFIGEFHRVDSGQVTDFKQLNSYYETYEKNRKLYENDDDKANLAEFLDEVTGYLDKKDAQLPLIKELGNMTSQVVLGPKEYLNATEMEELFQVIYKDKRVFMLRSQCGKFVPSLPVMVE